MTQLDGLREALRAISGKESAPADVQRLMALARVLGTLALPHHDCYSA